MTCSNHVLIIDGSQNLVLHRVFVLVPQSILHSSKQQNMTTTSQCLRCVSEFSWTAKKSSTGNAE